MTLDAQWWGYSGEHGWVILDRELPCNSPGLNPDLLFFRCRDRQTFVLKREMWRLPAYQFGVNYVKSLVGAASQKALEEFEEMKRLWPEFQAEIIRQYRATVDVQEEAEAREKAQKKALAAQERKARRLNKEVGETTESEE